VRNRGEERTLRGEVLVGLARDGPGTRALGEVVHRQEEQVAGAKEIDRLPVAHVAGHPYLDCRLRGDAAIRLGRHTRENDLDGVGERWIRLHCLPEALEQEDMRPRVEGGRQIAAAEQAPESRDLPVAKARGG